MSFEYISYISNIVYLILFAIPTGIISIVIAFLKPGNCDKVDYSGFDVSTYLMGFGFSNVIVSLFIIFQLIINSVAKYFKMLNLTKTIPLNIAVLQIIYGLFNIIWFIIGGIVLFRSNIECINSGSAHVIYALVLWCLSVCNIFINTFCQYKERNNSDNIYLLNNV